MGNKGTKDKYKNMSEQMLIEERKTTLSEMQKFVRTFEYNRKAQFNSLSMKKNAGFYIQMKRFNRLRNYISNRFTDSNYFSQSTMFDFMLYLLEGYLAGTYGDVEKFEDWHERMLVEAETKESNKLKDNHD